MTYPTSFTQRYGPTPGTRMTINGFQMQRYVPAQHFDMLNGWLASPYAKFWGMNELSQEERFKELVETDTKFGMLGQDNQGGAFYTELYDPRFDEIGQHYFPHAGDCGMHVLLGPATTPRHGFSYQVMVTIMTLILDQPGLTRVIVEPDVRNDKIHRLNQAVGINYQGECILAHKKALLGVATRDDFLNALNEKVES